MTIAAPSLPGSMRRLRCRRRGHDWERGDGHQVCVHCGRVGESVPAGSPAARMRQWIDAAAPAPVGDLRPAATPSPPVEAESATPAVAVDDLAPSLSPPPPPPPPPARAPAPDTVAVLVGVGVVGGVLVVGALWALRRRRVRPR